MIPPPRADAHQPVEVAAVRRDTVIDAIIASGEVEAIQSADLRPEVDGRIVKILMREGSEVEAGAPLFRIDDQDYLAAERQARAAGLALLGFYHSHPDHPAVPSQYDLDHAWPFFSYIIVSVRDGVPEDMTSWRLREDRSGFDPEELTYAKHDSHSNAASSIHR